MAGSTERTDEVAGSDRQAEDRQNEDRQIETSLRLLSFAIATGVLIALPFALQAGSEFFLPLVAALVIATALVPLLEWLERRGVPSA